MSLPLKSLPTGGFFKPGDYRDSVALLVEVTDFERQRPTQNGPKDSALVNVTAFKTRDDVAAGNPSALLNGTRVEQTAMARDCGNIGVGGAFVATIDQAPTTKGNPAWIWREVTDQSIVNGIIAFAEKRAARLDAAKASAPSFDD